MRRVLLLVACCAGVVWAQSWTLQRLPGGALQTGETASSKPLPATMPGGLAVFDFDGDGLLDLFFANGGEFPSGRKTRPEHSNRLLRNRGGMRFEDVTARAAISGTDYSFGATAADYDRDGSVDLLVTGSHGVALYRNAGGGVFRDVTASAGLAKLDGWAIAAAWFDKDNDGDLDLFVVRYVEWDPGKESRCEVDGKLDFCHPKHYPATSHALFENRGNGTFADVSEASGIAQHRGKGMSVAVADFNADGFADLFVTNDRVFNQLFLNREGKRFDEVAFDWGVAVPGDGNPTSSMGTDAQDFDGDGRVDLIYSALRDETFPIFRNAGAAFAEATASTRMNVLTRMMAGWGIVFADLDNDGLLDLAAARSDALSATGGRSDFAMEPPAWFRNAGGKFETGAGWSDLPRAMWRGAAAADLDNDGCLDVVLTALQQSPGVMRNPCPAGANWLKVDVREPGARVKAGEQWRVLSTSAGYASSNPGPLHFGLGNAGAVDVEVSWPGGKSKRIAAVKANQTLRVKP